MKPLKDIKVFKSLNCILCEKPFVPLAGQPQSPRILQCGSAMCNECFEKEKSLKHEEREHQCGNGCFSTPRFADFLIDVMSQDFLTFSPILGGYLLHKDFEFPTALTIPEFSESGVLNLPKYKSLQMISGIGGMDRWSDQFQNIINELPSMTHQLKEMTEDGYRFCVECKKLCIVDEMFHCNECVLKLCGACIYKNHHSHKANALLQNEADRMSGELCALSLIESKNSNKLFPALHKEITDALQEFEQKLLEKGKNLKDVANYANLKEKHQKYMKLKTDCESHAEDYMSHVRKYKTRIKKLIKTLDEDPN